MQPLTVYSSEIALGMSGVPAGAYGADGWEVDMGVGREEESGLQDEAGGCGVARKAAEGESGEVRVEKVAALRRAIADGKYLVTAEDLAEKLIEKMLG